MVTNDHLAEVPTWLAESVVRAAVGKLGEYMQWQGIAEDLMRRNGIVPTDGDYAAAERVIRPLLDEICSIYAYFGPRGGLSRNCRYLGLESARADVDSHPDNTVLVLLAVGNRDELIVYAAVRFLLAVASKWPDLHEAQQSRIAGKMLRRMMQDLALDFELSNRAYLAGALREARLFIAGHRMTAQGFDPTVRLQ